MGPVNREDKINTTAQHPRT